MSDTTNLNPGTIRWWDLTVPNAVEVRDFYQAVAGWEAQPVDMGEYSDFQIVAPATGEGMAGICFARGSNADLPPQWLIYITVEDVERAVAQCLAQCLAHGGRPARSTPHASA